MVWVSRVFDCPPSLLSALPDENVLYMMLHAFDGTLIEEGDEAREQCKDSKSAIVHSS